MNTPDIEIRAAQPDDLEAIRVLLSNCQLPTYDVTPSILSSFFVAELDGQLVGVCGFELFDTDGLLRSLAVAPYLRGKHLGERLVARCEAAAQSAHANHLYLLTTTADAYLRRLGYADISRGIAPLAIAAHQQFRGLCPASAKCLRKAVA